MVCTAKDLLEWKDFPKGLKVLVLDKDVSSASEIRSKLEGMDYIVSTFHHDNEAVSAVLDKFETFHVAIVEVSTIEHDGEFKFLQMAKGLPTVMVADAQCLTTTMKCIALGAIEVLNKPIWEDKLRNIWQHVVHKVYNAGESALPELPRPVTDSTILMVNKKDYRDEMDSTILMVKEKDYQDDMHEQMQCSSVDRCDYEKYPAPLTPQLKQLRIQDDAGCNDRNNWSTEKYSADHSEESKSVETTCCNAASDMPSEASQPMHDSVINDEYDSADGCKGESDTSPNQKNQLETSPQGGNARKESKASGSRGPCGPKTNRKKMKVDWTSYLQKKFIQAVEQLGVDQAIPSRILELMKVEGLTRQNVASHLQKYRMQRRHALPKRDERRVSLRPKDTMQSSYYYQHKPIMTFPTKSYHSNQTLIANQAYPSWVQPGDHAAGLQPWCGSSGYQTWPWKSYTVLQAEAWGCPVMPSLHCSYSYYPQNEPGNYSDIVTDGHGVPPGSHNDLADEVIDKIIKEAINKPPWVPLPIGLKPPSTESVLVELSKQGISDIPPT